MVKDDKFLQDPHLVARQLLEATSENAEANNDNGAVARCMILGGYCLHKTSCGIFVLVDLLITSRLDHNSQIQ